MKVAVQCESPLLQRSLEVFLSPYLSTLKQCQAVVRDRPGGEGELPTLVISNDVEGALAKPFTRSQLMLALEQLTKRQSGLREAAALSASFDEHEPEPETPPRDLALLEKRIDQLTREYRDQVIAAIRAFHEK